MNNRHVGVCAGSLLALAGLAQPALAQTNWLGNAPAGPNNWFLAANWSAGVPDSNTDAVLNAPGVFPVAEINPGNGTASTRAITVATTGIGQVNINSGALLETWGTAMIGDRGGSDGYVILGAAGNGNWVSRGVLTVGNSGAGTIYARNDSRLTATGFNVVVGRSHGGNGFIGMENTSRLTSSGSISIGDADGARGAMNVSGDARVTTPTLYVGRDSHPMGLQTQGTVTLFDRGLIEIGGTGHIGTAPGFNGAAAGMLRSNSANATIRDTSPGGNAVLSVHGSQARLHGRANYDIAVRYNSDRSIGVADRPVSVFFARNTLREGSTFNVAQGLSAQSGSAQLTFDVNMISKYAVSWSGPDYANDVDYVPGGPLAAARPTITVPYDPAQVTGGAGGFGAANTARRIGLFQIGANLRANERNGSVGATAGDKVGMIRNITSAIDPAAGMISGQTQNVSGNFDLAVNHNPIRPHHQDPSLDALQRGAYNLTGEGVLIGQLEPGLAYAAHGCFDDWTQADPAQRRLTYVGGAGNAPAANASSPHATLVASIMSGYDPLGVQVDGQSRFEPVANRYNNGYGYTGVAPRSRVVAQDWTNNATQITDITALVGAGPKIINISAGWAQTAGGGGPLPNGNNPAELALDRSADSNGIVVVQAAGNEGTLFGGSQNLRMPAGAFNNIVVGAVEFDRGVGGAAADNQSYPRHFDVAHAVVANFSSRGPTDGVRRAKPDIVAQGVGNLGAFAMEEINAAGNGIVRDAAYPEMGDRNLYSTQQRLGEAAARAIPGTSFATPTVSGVVALMVEDARKPRRPAGGDDPRVVKSILQTSADKPAGWARGSGSAADAANTAIPTSYSWGAGLLDGSGAIDLLRAGPPINTRYITADGWFLTTLQNADRTGFNGPAGNLPGDGFLLTDVVANTPLTMTLNWHSHVNAAMTARDALSQIFLELLSFDGTNWMPIPNLISNSAVDNLQHIWVPSMPVGGNVLARVFVNPGVPLAAPNATETYALSWDYTAVPAPATFALALLAGFANLRRRREVHAGPEATCRRR